MRKRFGDTAVPRTVIGGVVVEGVDETRIKLLCRPSGAEPTPIDVTPPDFPLPQHAAERRLAAPAIQSRG
jgi:hypothetical protein